MERRCLIIIGAGDGGICAWDGNAAMLKLILWKKKKKSALAYLTMVVAFMEVGQRRLNRRLLMFASDIVV